MAGQADETSLGFVCGSTGIGGFHGRVILPVSRGQPAEELLVDVLREELDCCVAHEDVRSTRMIGMDALLVPAFGRLNSIHAIIKMRHVHARGPCAVQRVNLPIFDAHTPACAFDDTQRMR